MPISNPPDISALVVKNSGAYTGDNSANRGISHGLGRVPKLVVMYGGTSFFNMNAHSSGMTQLNCLSGANEVSTTVTVANATNFYVGTGSSDEWRGNKSGIVYRWVAFG